jgi:hypothetical protein
VYEPARACDHPDVHRQARDVQHNDIEWLSLFRLNQPVVLAALLGNHGRDCFAILDRMRIDPVIAWQFDAELMFIDMAYKPPAIEAMWPTPPVSEFLADVLVPPH